MWLPLRNQLRVAIIWITILRYAHLFGHLLKRLQQHSSFDQYLKFCASILVGQFSQQLNIPGRCRRLLKLLGLSV
jgi:hypothetical protein